MKINNFNFDNFFERKKFWGNGKLAKLFAKNFNFHESNSKKACSPQHSSLGAPQAQIKTLALLKTNDRVIFKPKNKRVISPTSLARVTRSLVIANAFYNNNNKVKLATVAEANPKAFFSIATTSRCRGGCYSFPWIAPLYP